ncbi:MAG: inositol monophosphatase family protein [Bacteroidota bacterium]
MDNYLNLIKQSFTHEIPPCQDPSNKDEWARFGFYTAYHLYHLIMKQRFDLDKLERTTKADGSPTTTLEFEMEKFARLALRRFYEPAVFLGEESGGGGDDSVYTDQYLFVIDPIDGTRSFLSGFETYSITLSVIKNRIPYFSLVCSPSSGDMYFRVGSKKSMVLQIPSTKKKLRLHSIPLFSRSAERPVLVNLHPSKNAIPILHKLHDLWRKGEVALVKSVSGSPSLLMVEAAKTDTFYINAWDSGPTRPYDLMPALHIVNASNCVAVDRNKEHVDVWKHQGIYVVGPRGDQLNQLLQRIFAFG